ncbi:hypothetical protein EDD22DRAFT_736210, partial [Suillus occidentalis]
LGKAGTPYARSVQGTNPLPHNQMPDAGLIFDTLLRRDKVALFDFISFILLLNFFSSATPHPQGMSALMFSFAALVSKT